MSYVNSFSSWRSQLTSSGGILLLERYVNVEANAGACIIIIYFSGRRRSAETILQRKDAQEESWQLEFG